MGYARVLLEYRLRIMRCIAPANSWDACLENWDNCVGGIRVTPSFNLQNMSERVVDERGLVIIGVFLAASQP